MALDKNEEQCLERLSNDELRKFLPDLKLEEVFLTQIRIGRLWTDLVTVKNKKEAQIECNLCKELLGLDTFKIHMNSEVHEKALQTVEQFYHPFYTYSKEAEKLACGESVPKEELQIEIAKANSAFSTKEGSRYAIGKHMARRMQVLETSPPNDLQNLVLQTPAENPENMFAVVCLSIKELLLVEFTRKPNEWQKMLNTEQPLPNGKYFCALCEKFCAGIITVNAHLSGYTHKKLQLATRGVRLKTRPYLTKNCIYRSDTLYSLTICKEGRLHFQKQLDELPSPNGKQNSLIGNQSPNRDDTGNRSSTETAVELEIAGNSNQGLEKNEEAENFQPENSANPAENASKRAVLADDIKKKAQKLASNVPMVVSFQDPKKLPADEDGLIGVEYVVKIEQYPIVYECCLCKAVLDQKRMADHLIGYNHRLKYCTTHYPDTIKKFNSELSDLKRNKINNVMGFILARLAVAIEKHHGRSAPLSISASNFQTYRREILYMLYDLPHASHLHGPSFSNILSHKDMQDLKKSNQTYKPPRTSGNQVVRFENITENSYTGKKAIAELQLLFNREQFGKRNSQSRSRSTQRERKRVRREYESRPANVWEEYHKELLVSTAKIERLYNKYRKNPESHPFYDQEWNSFWTRRKKELISLGMDYRSHNYQPEWVYYFKSRLEELYTEALSDSKISVRKRLNLSPDGEKDHTKISSLSNFDAEFYPEKNLEQNLESNSKLHSDNRFLKMPRSESAIVDEKPNIIHVLRLLTALEDHLGSCGVKIMELLSLTLVQEKLCVNKPGELEERILSSNNCTLLETVMEKLKGIIYAGLIDGKKLHSFNRVIQCTANLLDHANKMGWREKNTLNETNTFQNIKNNNRSQASNDFNNQSSANTYGVNQFKMLSTFRNVSQPSFNQINNRNLVGWENSSTTPINNSYGCDVSGLNIMRSSGNTNNNFNIMERTNRSTTNIKPLGYNNAVGAEKHTHRMDYGNIQTFTHLANTPTIRHSIQTSSTLSNFGVGTNTLSMGRSIKSNSYGKGAGGNWGRFDDNSQSSSQNTSFHQQNFQQQHGHQ